MPFVVSQYCRPNVDSGGPIYYREVVQGEDGKEDYSMVSQSKELPSMDTFRLKNQLANGLNLERVDTKMMAPRELDLNNFENPNKKEGKPEQTNQLEQTNQSEQTNQLEQTNQSEQTNQQQKGVES